MSDASNFPTKGTIQINNRDVETEDKNDDDKNSDSFKMNSNDLVQNNDLPDSYPTNN
jgi:hypothetical protein